MESFHRIKGSLAFGFFQGTVKNWKVVRFTVVQTAWEGWEGRGGRDIHGAPQLFHSGSGARLGQGSGGNASLLNRIGASFHDVISAVDKNF
jgi:hypothetical protein